MAIHSKYVLQHTMHMAGWRDTSDDQEELSRRYALSRAEDYVKNHNLLTSLASSGTANGQNLFFSEPVEYVDFSQMTVQPRATMTDPQMRVLNAPGGTRWARTLGDTVQIGHRKTTSFSEAGRLWGQAALSFCRARNEDSNTGHPAASFLLENGRYGMGLLDAHRVWVYEAL